MEKVERHLCLCVTSDLIVVCMSGRGEGRRSQQQFSAYLGGCSVRYIQLSSCILCFKNISYIWYVYILSLSLYILYVYIYTSDRWYDASKIYQIWCNVDIISVIWFSEPTQVITNFPSREKNACRLPLLQCMRFGNKATVLQTSSPLFRQESSDVSLQTNPSSWWTKNLQPVIAEASCKTDWCPWACEAWVVERGTHLLRSVCTASEVVLCTNPKPASYGKPVVDCV